MRQIGLIGLFVISLFLVACNPYTQVCIKDKCFDVEIADEAATQSKGLMERDNLGQNKGMVFIYSKSANRPFWMYKTNIPLDILWIDENFTVVSIVENAHPCFDKFCETYDPEVNSTYVLEINAGLSDKLGFDLGDKVEFRNINVSK